MELQAKQSRKRVVNFTTEEKALLAHLIKKKPIVESKFTDGNSIVKKQAAWDLITREFNCHANVNKRETITLKRAWDNMKAMTRRTRAIERGNHIRTGGGPQQPPPSSQQEAIISMVEDAAPVMITEINNTFDSDGTILSAIDSQEPNFLTKDSQSSQQTLKDDDIVNEEEKLDVEFTSIVEGNLAVISSPVEDMPIYTEQTNNYLKSNATILNVDKGRRPADYIRREAVLRIKHLENKKKIETQILKIQLEVEEIKKRAALLEEEKNKILLDKARFEFDILKK